MPNISVAMPVYNGVRYLPEQMDSILKQLLPGDEFVISYDDSVDGTWELIKSYEERYSQIKVTINDCPGISGNFNHAISTCVSEYIFISDQDDIWAENKRKKVIETFEKTKADMVIHNGVHIDISGNPVSDPFFSIYRIGDGKIKNLLKPRYSGCCMAFTREMKGKILPIPSDIDAYDHWLGMVSECCGKIAYCDDVLLYHRLHGNNVTPTSPRSLNVIARSRITMVRELRKRMKRERSRQNGKA